MAEEHIVELRKESHRGRSVFVGAWRIGEIEQLAAARVAEGSELRTKFLHHGAQSLKPGPTLRVGD